MGAQYGNSTYRRCDKNAGQTGKQTRKTSLETLFAIETIIAAKKNITCNNSHE